MVPLESIQLATLCSGAKRFDEGNATETWKGSIQTHFGQKVAFIKVLPNNQLISETACALLARALGLNVPPPYLVRVHKEQLRQSRKWGKDETEKICFGSEEIDHLSLARILFPKRKGKSVPVHPSVMIKIRQQVAACEGFQETAIFDEWIANGDRHEGNLLWDGRKFYLIDHSHSLTGGKWKVTSLIPDVQMPNRLLDPIVNQLDWNERQAWKQKADLERFRYRELPLATLQDMAGMELYDKTGIGLHAVNFIEKRINNLLHLICSRLDLGILPI